MNSLKKIYIDVETTGTDPERNGIHQLAGIVESGEQVMQEFDYRIKPFPKDEIKDSALLVSGTKREDLETYQAPAYVYLEFRRMLDQYIDKFNKRDKFIFIGYNSRFDDAFLREWFKKNGDNYYGSYFWWPAIDVSNMAAVRYQTTRSVFPDFKLMTVASVTGIELGEQKAHDAMYDIGITRQMFKYFEKGI